MSFIIVTGKNIRIEEEFSQFIRRFDIFEDKKEFTVGDIISVYPADVTSIILNGDTVLFKDLVRGWIPDEKKIIFTCKLSMKEARENASSTN